MNKLKALQAKIIEAVPEIMRCGWCGSEMDERTCEIASESLNEQSPHQEKQWRDITLEDVLIVLKTKKEWRGIDYLLGAEPMCDGEINYADLDLFSHWQLGKSLNEQSQDLINFLHNLLCIKR